MLLRKLARDEGLTEVSDPAQADAVWVSVCDISEIRYLRSARCLGRPVVSGGFVSFLPAMRLWSDYTCVGEAYDFVRQYALAKRLKDLVELPYVATPTKPHETIDERIEWTRNPIVKTSAKAFYWYSGKGCKNHCRFCLLSHSRSWQQAPESQFSAAVRAVPYGGKLYPMASMLTYPRNPERDARLGTLDVRVRDLVNGRTIFPRRIRTGIEFFTEANRRLMGKPISREEITALYMMTAENKTESAFYHIVGLPGDDPAEYLDAIPSGSAMAPRVILAFTYLDPQPMTPIADWDITERVTFNGKEFMRQVNWRNRRLRVQGPKYKAFPSWRTIMQRAQDRDELEFAWSLRTEKDDESLLNACAKRFPRLLGTKSMAELIHASPPPH